MNRLCPGGFLFCEERPVKNRWTHIWDANEGQLDPLKVLKKIAECQCDDCIAIFLLLQKAQIAHESGGDMRAVMMEAYELDVKGSEVLEAPHFEPEGTDEETD